MNNIATLENLDFGSRIAESEAQSLKKYFLSGQIWSDLRAGKKDIIFGAKGSGKSALYLNLFNYKTEFDTKNIHLIEAENPQGQTVFSLLKQKLSLNDYESPPQEELVKKDIAHFWKLYLLTIIVSNLKERHFTGKHYKLIKKLLEECHLLPPTLSIETVFRHVAHYVSQFLRGVLQTEFSFGEVSIKPNIVFQDPNPQQAELGYRTPDDLFKLLNEDLKEADLKQWILLDRLDVAFQEDLLLEERALKALFTVYNHFQKYSNIQLKIFLRDDIWQKITIDGMREASHITRTASIRWDEDKLFNLMMKRIFSNETIVHHFKKDTENIDNYEDKKSIFNRIFPKTIENQPCFEWITKQLKDGLGNATPRELIHLFEAWKKFEIEYLEAGRISETLFQEKTIKSAIYEVSKTKMEQTLFAEYPELKQHFSDFLDYEKNKSDMTLDPLALTFRIELDAMKRICERLCEIGFLSKSGFESYCIAPIYKNYILLRGK